MAKRLVYLGICIAFYALFFDITRFIWNKLPNNGLTDILGMFVIVFVNIPLSAICTQKVITIIKKND